MFSTGVIANRLRYPFEVAAPADLVVAADRATLSDAGIAFAAADKANLSAAGATTIDPAYGRKRYGVWVNMTTAPTTTPQEILGLGSRFSLFLSGDGAPIGSAKVIIAAISDEPQEAGVISINQWVFLEVESWAEDSGMGGLDILARARINAGTWSDISVNQETVEVEPVSTPLKIGINFNGRMDSGFVADENVSNFYNAGSGFTFSQVPQNQIADIFHWWDFSARSSTGVWFDAVGGANLTEEFDATSSATKLNLVTGITAGLARAYGTDVGDSVSLWLDRSGKANDLAQTSIVSQPMMVEFGGINWIRFDGVDDIIAISPALDTTERTVVVVNEHGVFITEHNGGFANIDTWGIKGFLLRGGRLRQILIADRVLTATEKARIKRRFPVSGVSSLTSLENWLRSCNISGIDKDFLKYTPNVTNLREFLLTNSLTSIDKDFLQYTPNVTNLRSFLHSNNLTSIDKDFLQHTPNANNFNSFLRNNNLTSIDPDFFQYTPNIVSLLNVLNDNALDQASVDGLLVSLESYNTSNITVGISGGTNATPSATGQAATDALRARGWTVALNGY